MNKGFKILLLVLLALGAISAAIFFIHPRNAALFSPKGAIAEQERDLMVTAILLILIVVVPALVLTFTFAWRYRAGNPKAKYSPNLDRNAAVSFVWWVFPTTIIFILAIITWQSTHKLDPYRPLDSATKPLTIQVVALNWKWLFIYPEQNIATVNFVEFPEHTPLNFELTADAPMNSFWIPELGGQIYAMAGMGTQLHLVANETGEFAGRSAEINGRGFAGMKFVAKATSASDFNAWVGSVRQSPKMLGLTEYNKLAEPSENNPVAYYAAAEKDLYNTIIMKFMMPASSAGGSSSTMPGKDMSGMVMPN